ncbi:hypothetical protein F-VV10_0160 [Faustovirus]|nr:hypothetical protein F-VV10_0160 [Faustovirus]
MNSGANPNTNDTIIDLSAATDSIPVVPSDSNVDTNKPVKLRVIMETNDPWSAVGCATISKSEYEAKVPDISKTLKIHVLGEFTEGDTERRAELNTLQDAWIHNFIANCTRNLRTGEWVWPEKLTTDCQRSVYAMFTYGGKTQRVICKVGAYRAMREALADYMYTDLGDSGESTPAQREAQLAETDDNPLLTIFRTTSGGVHIRLCNDDEMTTLDDAVDMMGVLSQPVAMKPSFKPVMDNFIKNLAKYTAFTAKMKASEDLNEVREWQHDNQTNNTPVDSADFYDSTQKSHSACHDSTQKSHSACYDSTQKSHSTRYDSNNSDDDDLFDELFDSVINRGNHLDNNKSTLRLRKRAQNGENETPIDIPNINNDGCTGATILTVISTVMAFIVFLSIFEQMIN